MNIAYPLQDITSAFNKKKTYQKKGKATKIIYQDESMAILENRSGERFSANLTRLIWYTAGPGP